jgi:hypothetical protein
MEPCLLDNEVFTCCNCGKKLDHTQGTWLPIGEEAKSMILEKNETVTVLGLSDFLNKPEIITSDEFTCYDCL